MFAKFRLSRPRWAALITLVGAFAAGAQQPAAPSAPVPAASAARPSASAAAPADLSYRSALQDYQPFGDEKVAPWREANDNVGRIGGWRSYAHEAQGAASAAQRPHSGHGKP